MSQDIALQVNNLRVSYMTGDQEVKAVDDVTFSLYAGERLGIVGESGSGKTTLALALMRLHKPPASIEGGEILLGGHDVLDLDREGMRRLRWSPNTPTCSAKKATGSRFTPMARRPPPGRCAGRGRAGAPVR